MKITNNLLNNQNYISINKKKIILKWMYKKTLLKIFDNNIIDILFLILYKGTLALMVFLFIFVLFMTIISILHLTLLVFNIEYNIGYSFFVFVFLIIITVIHYILYDAILLFKNSKVVSIKPNGNKILLYIKVKYKKIKLHKLGVLDSKVFLLLIKDKDKISAKRFHKRIKIFRDFYHFLK